MKTKTTIALLFAGYLFQAQTIANFETFTLAPNSAYSPTTNTPFQTVNASFEYNWNTAFNFWSAGFAYTNKQDSSNGTFTNLYGVRALKGYTNSATYVVAQDRAVIKLKAPFDKVEGFYITNTTYAYKEIRNGSSISRKFGDTLGTGSGTAIPQGSYPDYFKVTARGYKNGTLKNDSAVFFLANYTFTNNTQDYIVNTWQWFNTSSLGQVDSIKFFMFSSDTGAFGINTPLFFAMDDFTTSAPNPVAIKGGSENEEPVFYPNPFNEFIELKLSGSEIKHRIVIRDLSGKPVFEHEGNDAHLQINTGALSRGVYFVELSSDGITQRKKMLKH